MKDDCKIINGIENEVKSKQPLRMGRFYPVEKESPNRFPEKEIVRVTFDQFGKPEYFGDHEPNKFSEMSYQDFNIENLAAAGVDVEEVSLRGSSSPLNDTYANEQLFNREMSNPQNFELNEN